MLRRGAGRDGIKVLWMETFEGEPIDPIEIVAIMATWESILTVTTSKLPTKLLDPARCSLGKRRNPSDRFVVKFDKETGGKVKR